MLDEPLTTVEGRVYRALRKLRDRARGGLGLGAVSPFWVWCQILIVVFVLAGMIIALTKLI